jgi:hypothetical protein
MSVFRDYCSMDVEIALSKTETKTVTIDRNSRFFVKMVRRDFINVPFIGVTYFGKTYSGDNNREEWVECYINEDQFLVNMNDEENPPYKIKLTACDQSFGSETFYWESFLSMLRGGYILLKENEFQRPIPYKNITPIPNSCATIVEEGTVVVDVRDYI